MTITRWQEIFDDDILMLRSFISERIQKSYRLCCECKIELGMKMKLFCTFFSSSKYDEINSEVYSLLLQRRDQTSQDEILKSDTTEFD